MLSAAFFYFLWSIGFLLWEMVWLNINSLRSEVTALATKAVCWNLGGPRRAPRHPWQHGADSLCTAVLVCSRHRENHLFHLERGWVPHALPPASQLQPQLPCFDEQWGDESPVLKILWFYLDKKNLPCLHCHTKIVLVWVNLQSSSRWKYLALLFFL